MGNKEVSLIPYLNFLGNCEEALNAYSKILDGEVDIMERYDNPNLHAPEHYKDKILHARFVFGDNEFYASDIFPEQGLSRGPNVAMSLTFTNLERAKKVFTQLSEGGKVNVPFEKQFWGAWHGTW